MPIWQVRYTKSSNPAIGRFQSCPHSISHAQKHICSYKNHVSRSIKLLQKKREKMLKWLFVYWWAVMDKQTNTMLIKKLL